MKRRIGRRVCLGFQWDVRSWEDAPLWCDYLFGKLEGRKIHWNLPALSPDSPQRTISFLAKTLRGRGESTGDTIASMGFAGACHPLLTLDELEKELTWGLKNPWGTGLTDTLGVHPEILIPPVPDLARPDAWKLYRSHGFTAVGSRSGRFPAGTEPGCFSYVLLRAATAGRTDPETRNVRRLIAAHGELFLVIDLSGLTSPAPLKYIVEDCAAPLLAMPAGSFSLITDGAGFAARPGQDGPGQADWSPFPSPVLHAKLAAAEPFARRKRKRMDEYRQILSIMAPGGDLPAEPVDGKKESPASLRLVAHMLGDVSLAGPEFDVRLSGGRFCGMTRHGTDLLPRRPAVSYLRTQGRTCPYKTRSSFSFEGENGTGLREELTLEGQAGASLSIEYSFRDECPLLCIHAEARYPRISGPVEEYAPFAFALVEVPRRPGVEVAVSAPDGSASAAHLWEHSGWVLLPGAAHRIQRPGGGTLLLRFAPPEGKSWGIPFFRVVRAGRRLLLEVNPFGSYAPVPASALSGHRETFSLFLGVEDG